MPTVRSYKKFGLHCRKMVRLTLLLLFIPAGLIWISSYYALHGVAIRLNRITPHKMDSGKESIGVRERSCSLLWGMGHVIFSYNQAYTDYFSKRIPASSTPFRIDWSRIDLFDPLELLSAGNWHGFEFEMDNTGPIKDAAGSVQQWSRSASIAFPAWLLFSISLIAPIFYLFRGLRRIRESSTRRGFAPIVEERPGDTKSNATNVSGEHR